MVQHHASGAARWSCRLRAEHRGVQVAHKSVGRDSGAGLAHGKSGHPRLRAAGCSVAASRQRRCEPQKGRGAGASKVSKGTKPLRRSSSTQGCQNPLNRWSWCQASSVCSRRTPANNMDKGGGMATNHPLAAGLAARSTFEGTERGCRDGAGASAGRGRPGAGGAGVGGRNSRGRDGGSSRAGSRSHQARILLDKLRVPTGLPRQTSQCTGDMGHMGTHLSDTRCMADVTAARPKARGVLAHAVGKDGFHARRAIVFRWVGW